MEWALKCNKTLTQRKRFSGKCRHLENVLEHLGRRDVRARDPSLHFLMDCVLFFFAPQLSIQDADKTDSSKTQPADCSKKKEKGEKRQQK